MYNSYYEKILATGEVKCIEDEIPFEIPESWEWERWGNISQSIQYGYNAPALKSGDVRMVRISDIQNGKVLWESVPYCNIQESEIANYLLLEDDILFARTGGTVGKSFLVTETPYPAIFAGYLIRTRYSKLLYAKYMKFFMESELYWNQLREGTIATAQPNCNGKTLGKMLLPIPPYSEQDRIVRKIEQITTFINKYQDVSEELNRLDNNLNEDFKKSILQYAIQGKLVPQIDVEEPATILLEKIHAEKLQLLKEGKLKKKDIQDSVIFKDDDNRYYEKVGSIVNDITDEIPYELPTGWQWVRMKNCCIRIFSGKSPKYSKIPTNHLIIGQQANQWDGVKMQYAKYGTDEFVQKIEDYQYLIDGDVLLNTLGNGTLGRCGIFENISNKVLTDGHLFVFRTDNKLLARYLLFFLTVNYAEINKKADGSTNQTFLNLSKMSNYLIPIPPANEVKRIIEKIHILQKSIEGL